MKHRENTIFGIHPILEALKSELVLDKLFIQKDSNHSKIQEIVTICEKSDVTINYVPLEKLNRLTKGNHQFVIQ